MIKTNFIIAIISIFVASCSNNVNMNKRLSGFKKQTKFKEINWGSFIVKASHIEYSDIIYPSSLDAFGYCGAFFMIELDKKNFKIQKEYFQKAAIGNYSYFDKCNLFITNQTEIDTVSCDENRFPVPDIKNSLSPLVQSNIKFNDNSTFIILDYKEGDFLKEPIIKDDDPILNNRITNSGFCKGVLIQDEVSKIVYWIIIWKI